MILPTHIGYRTILVIGFLEKKLETDVRVKHDIAVIQSTGNLIM
jgi:hypothetical protein